MKKQADPTAKPAAIQRSHAVLAEGRVRNGQRMADQGCTRITTRSYVRPWGEHIARSG